MPARRDEDGAKAVDEYYPLGMRIYRQAVHIRLRVSVAINEERKRATWSITRLSSDVKTSPEHF